MSIYAGRDGTPGSGDETRADARPLISIAMCTYNGEAYLRGQLVSFVEQTQRPDELVVCDDGSTDNTLQVLEQFSKEAPFPVRVYRNRQRLGPTSNFDKALSLCKGDFIFLADQDDVWLPQKVNTLLEAMRSNPGAGYVFSDALIVDEMLRPMGYTMWQSIRFAPGQRRRFKRGRQLDVLLKHNVVTGATMAFRAGLKATILPIPAEPVHDEWIALLASSAGMYGLLLEEPLIAYRQHSEQLLGGRKVGFIEQVKQTALGRGQAFESRLHQEEVKCSQVLDRLVLTGQLQTQVQRLFDAKIGHLRARRAIHERAHHARLAGVSRECLALRYHRFSYGWKSAVRDLLF